MFILRWSYILVCCSLTVTLYGQGIDTTRTVEDLVKNVLLGSGVVVGNITYKGEKHAIGRYTDDTNQLGITEGILLTTGNVFFALGPNKSPRTGWASDAPGDKELDAIARGKTYDAAILEFDFVTTSENLVFQYVFASEEYLEYVGSKFNDVFAFFVEGPESAKINIATLPDGVTPITVNTVNNESNSAYYIDNTYLNTTEPFVWDVRNRKVVENKHYLQEEILPEYNIQFDGFTTVLEAKCRVVPNQVYHIKIAISDVGDGILDSGVILKGQSFRSFGEQAVVLDDHFDEFIEPKVAEMRKVELVPSGHQLTRGIPREVKIGSIEFPFDEYAVPAAASSVLTKVLNEWYKKPNSKIRIVGHTDDWGSDGYNERLSRNRSNAVAKALKGLGIPPDKLEIHYFGEKKPVQTNSNTSGRARNRRVELVIIY